MPTPSEENTRTTRPVDIAATSSRNSFTSCPPDEEREQHAPREERVGGDAAPADADSATTVVSSARAEVAEMPSDGHAATITQQPTPEPEDAEAGASVRTPSPSGPDKGEPIDDPGLLADPASPSMGSSTDTPSDSDARLAQSMLSAAISPSTPPPQYLHFPDLHMNRTTSPNSTTSFLRPGSKFKGTQQSDRQVYEVQVELKDVNLAESFLCGYLRIQGLTDDHPTLTTFFEGEVIGPKHLFKTTHASWGSNEKVDLQHWARFPAWRPLAKSAKSPNFTLKNFLQREHVFMRWKEYFLVPDHRVKTITGASFEGFYYICFNQCSGSVSGIYFHAKSEKYQQLELRHVDERGCMPAMEFR